ncbi:DUF421 domain-containing protein [Bordetella genomosp. 6]|uniref:DUF421 domain-containing protein n=1 Tax=Bordetella genomosp. 6 TaxID=463024 RepID=UPI000A28E6D1|nr:YetF domain-containing protein [Bordetella genomosp. 6]ARP76499.1 hypothetical protein CAL11_10250 [Bordetella genomosp. 6]
MDVDWNGMFELTVPPLELFLRGSLIYWFLLALLRLAGRRDIGSLGVADMLVLVLIADAAQNAMAGEYKSVTDGAILLLTIVGWTVAIDRASYFLPSEGRLLAPSTVCLVRDGELQRRNMRREYITEDELMSELRLKGYDSLDDVHRAYMEPDGNISALRRHG